MRFMDHIMLSSCTLSHVRKGLNCTLLLHNADHETDKDPENAYSLFWTGSYAKGSQLWQLTYFS